MNREKELAFREMLFNMAAESGDRALANAAMSPKTKVTSREENLEIDKRNIERMVNQRKRRKLKKQGKIPKDVEIEGEIGLERSR